MRIDLTNGLGRLGLGLNQLVYVRLILGQKLIRIESIAILMTHGL